MFSVLWFCGGIAVVLGGRVDADEVTSLPGWDRKLPSRVYSGFLDSTPPGETTKMHMHYIFMESERDPANDPVLVWSNGGPGAGSEFGLFTELGPLSFSDLSLKTEAFNKTGIPTPMRNDYAWTKLANILIYDSPPPVGFSYCGDDIGGDGYSCGDWDDARTAKAAHTFLEHWMGAFTDYAKHDLYLSGESYAGVYIPTLAREILDFDSDTRNHLKGFAIGDGCAGTEVLCGKTSGPWFNIEFMHGHGQVSDKLYTSIVKTCGMEQLERGVTDPACKQLVDKMETAIGGFYGYNLYDECGTENVFLPNPTAPDRNYWSSVPAVAGALNDYPCGGTGAMLQWLSLPTVRSALHVPAAATFFLTDNGEGFNYTTSEKNLMPFYKHLAEDTNLRVLVYNGDTDPGINSFVSQNWTVSLGLPEAQPWRAWTLDGKQTMGGYVTRYAGDFDFLTIRGSGHMVPEYKPAASFSFISKWLANEEYPAYKPQ